MDHPKPERADDGSWLLGSGAYREEVEVAAISGDGRRVLTEHEVGVARVWDVETGEMLAEITPESPLAGTQGTAPWREEFLVFIESAALSLDGTHALLGLNDSTAVVHRVEDGKRLAVLHPPGEEPATQWGVIRSVAYSPDGSLILVGFFGRSVGVWSADDFRPIAFLTAESSTRLVGRPFVRDTLVSSVAVSSDHRTLFAGASDRTAAVFDLASSELLQEMTQHAEEILTLFDNDVGIGWATTAGSIWIARDGGPVRKEIDTGENWSEVILDGDRWLARSPTGAVTLGTLAGERSALVEPSETLAGGARTLGLAGERLYYPESVQRLVLLDGRRRTVVERQGSLTEIRPSPQGDLLAVSGSGDELELWDLSGSLVRSLACPGHVGCFCFSPDGSLVAMGEIGDGGGHYPRHVYVYETTSGELRWRLEEHDWQIRAMAFSADGGLLVSLGDELVVWSRADLDRSRMRPILCVRLSRVSGTFRIAGGEVLALEGGEVRVFAGARERLRFEAPMTAGTLCAISENQRYLLVAGNQEVRRYDLATGRLHRHVEAPIDRPQKLPSSRIAHELDTQAWAMLWRTPFGSFLHQTDGPRGWIERLELSAEGLVAVPASEGAVVLRVVGDRIRVMGTVPFQGKLRASRIVNGEVILVNEEGRVFRHLRSFGP